jgi:hypothetical protein
MGLGIRQECVQQCVGDAGTAILRCYEEPLEFSDALVANHSHGDGAG